MRKPTRLLPQKRPTNALALPAAAAVAGAGAAAAAAADAAGSSEASAVAAGAGFGMAAALAGFGSAVTAGQAGSRAAGGSSSMMQGYAAAGAAAAPGSSATIDAYYLSRHCAVCDELTRAAEPLCERCRGSPQVAAVVLAARAARLERQHQHLVRLCQSCGGGGGWNVRHGGVVCGSLDCGVYYERYKVVGEMRSMSAVAAAGLQLL
jgi:DnaJ-class molecular chaperone